jgi:hypothetical protein
VIDNLLWLENEESNHDWGFNIHRMPEQSHLRLESLTPLGETQSSVHVMHLQRRAGCQHGKETRPRPLLIFHSGCCCNPFKTDHV